MKSCCTTKYKTVLGLFKKNNHVQEDRAVCTGNDCFMVTTGKSPHVAPCRTRLLLLEVEWVWCRIVRACSHFRRASSKSSIPRKKREINCNQTQWDMFLWNPEWCKYLPIKYRLSALASSTAPDSSTTTSASHEVDGRADWFGELGMRIWSIQAHVKVKTRQCDSEI